MLDFIRKNAQSWGVKALFGIIVLVFVFWGVGSFRGKQKSTLATINDRELSTREFLNTYQQRLDSLRRQNQSLSPEQLQQMDFKRQVFDQMVNQILLLQEAKRLGFSSSDAEISARIRSMQPFQEETTQTFQMERYKALLQANRMTPAQFESDLGQDILTRKMLDSLSSSVQAEEEQARELFTYVTEKARIEYILLASEDFVDQVELSDQEISAHYQDHKDRFRQPARMKMKYLPLTPAGLAPYQEVGQEEIETYYRENKDQFVRPEAVKAAHILIEIPQDASEEEEQAAEQKIIQIANRIKRGEPFSEVAREQSQAPSADQGGDIGWFERGSMVESFEETAFALKKGEISDPVRTRFGLHLIKLEDKRPAGVKPLARVKGEIRSWLAEDKAAENLEDILDKALSTILSTGNIEAAAADLGLELKESGWFSQEAGPEALDLEQEALTELFALQTGEVTDRPIFLDQGYLLALKTEEKPAHVSPLETVRDEIVKQLKDRKAMELARKEAAVVLQSLNKNQGSDVLAEYEPEQSEAFTRRGFIPGLGMNPELAEAAFSAENNAWLERPYKVSRGFVLARRTERISPPQEQWQEQKSFWISRLNQNQKESLQQAYIEGLRASAEIRIVSPELLTY
ncbi:MAG: SurA N-terminal domain-containing protein [Desulfohalobiaceae bacterium]|nr:SurA N-terminal domain-containing protein [Desulfohalobiaceae bacterium]